jgi:hypothetical protein
VFSSRLSDLCSRGVNNREKKEQQIMNLFRSKTVTLHLKNSINCSPLRRAFLLIPLALALFAVAPAIRAVVPPPDGGYAGNNTAEGQAALQVLTTGTNNTALGFHALNSNGTGSNNTATGYLSLHVSTRASNNTADGSQALFSNTTGSENTAVGRLALGSNQDGRLNTANGFEALSTNQHGSENTATGDTALFANTADGNTADGSGALHDNTTGNGNTATGDVALFFNTIGHDNTADGFHALVQNTQGTANTADGFQALDNNTTGHTNIAVGFLAGHNLTTGSCNIDIGNNGEAGESNTIRIGTQISREGGCGQTATFIAGINEFDASAGLPVFILPTGQLGTGPGLVALDYKHERDRANAMLTDEILKQRRIVQELKGTVVQQQKQIDALTAGLQKVSAQLEVSKAAPQTVLNNQ